MTALIPVIYKPSINKLYDSQLETGNAGLTGDGGFLLRARGMGLSVVLFQNTFACYMNRMTQSLFNYPTIYFEWCVVFTKRMYLHLLHLISSNRTCDALYSTAAACRSIVRPVSLAGPCRRDQLETGTARLTGYGGFLLHARGMGLSVFLFQNTFACYMSERMTSHYYQESYIFCISHLVCETRCCTGVHPYAHGSFCLMGS